MRKRMMIAAALAALLAPLPAAAQKWYRVADGTETRSYIDLDSIRPEGELLVAQTFSVLLTPTPGSPVHWVLTTTAFDCKGHRGRLDLVIGYDAKRGEVFNRPNFDGGKFRPHGPGTDSVNMSDFVCNVARENAVLVADPWTDEP
ncbi:MAG: surface-adhesin E family protein [Sphingomonas sp.]